jgi:putative FmdB family regulatory protein
MPIYEYECTKCKKQHEVMQKITEKPLKKCPECGGSLRKLMSSTSFVLKGTGWYATDYASDKKKGEGSSKRSAKDSGSRIEGVEKPVTKTETGSDTKESTKPETKSETKESSKSETKESKAS